MSISNKYIVITGAGSGIGLELVHRLSLSNNQILGIDRSQEGLESLSNHFPKINTLCLDLTEAGSVTIIFQWIKDNWGVIDFFFANAGFAQYGTWEKTDSETLESMLRVNVLFPIQIAKTLFHCDDFSSCRLVVTASAMSYWPVPGYAGYAATKAAMHQFVETVRSEGLGDRITMVYPGATDTGFFKNAGKKTPKAFAIQSVKTVVERIINGVEKGKKRIFPSSAFRLVMVLNRILPIFKPIYFLLERKKLKKWTAAQKQS